MLLRKTSSRSLGCGPCGQRRQLVRGGFGDFATDPVSYDAPTDYVTIDPATPGAADSALPWGTGDLAPGDPGYGQGTEYVTATPALASTVAAAASSTGFDPASLLKYMAEFKVGAQYATAFAQCLSAGGNAASCATGTGVANTAKAGGAGTGTSGTSGTGPKPGASVDYSNGNGVPTYTDPGAFYTWGQGVADPNSPEYPAWRARMVQAGYNPDTMVLGKKAFPVLPTLGGVALGGFAAWFIGGKRPLDAAIGAGAGGLLGLLLAEIFGS